MKSFEEIKKAYDYMKIEGLEESICDVRDLRERTHKTLITVLYYLERTKRYKENKAFAKSSFAVYLRDRFNISESEYRRSRMAYVSFPDEAEKHGVGFVSRVVSRCSAADAPKVFKSIDKLQKDRKTTVTINDREDILALHAAQHRIQASRIKAVKKQNADKPRTEAQPIPYSELVRRNAELEKENASLRSEISAKDEQITKLIAALAAMREGVEEAVAV